MTTTNAGSRRHHHGDRLSPSLSGMPWVLLRLVLGGGIAALAIGATVAEYVVGLVATTGCFLECQDPNLLLGLPSLAVAPALFASGLAALWWGLVDRHWRTAVEVLVAVAFVGFFALMAIVTVG